MSDSFKFEVKESPDGIVTFNLVGAIDEQAKLPGDFDLSNFKKARIDFDKVEYINSGGTKAWINFCDHLNQHPALQITFLNCPPMVVNQINTVSGFLPSNAKVESALVPVICKKCDRCFNVPINVAMLNTEFDELTDKVRTNDRGDAACCKHALEVDVLKEYYFRFTNR